MQKQQVKKTYLTVYLTWSVICDMNHYHAFYLAIHV